MGKFSVCYFPAIFIFFACGVDFAVDATTQYLNAASITQYVSSPNYPSNYPISTSDDWIIDSGSSAYTVEINVLDFSTESDSSCSYDYVRFYDGSSSSSAYHGPYCGTLSSCYFKTSGRYARIYFYSDSSSTRRGFRLSYRRNYGTRASPVSSCGGSQNSGSSSSSSYTSSKTYYIAGGSTGGIISFIVIVLLFCYCCKGNQTRVHAITVF